MAQIETVVQNSSHINIRIDQGNTWDATLALSIIASAFTIAAGLSSLWMVLK